MGLTQTARRPPFDQFLAYRRFSAGLAFAPDGQHVYFVSNLSGQFNLWRVRIDGGWPRQLTAFNDETVRMLGVSPRDGTVVFCADHDGDEFHQLYVLDPDGGWPEQITDAAAVQHLVGGDAFSPDGTKLAYAANARIPSDMEVWVRDVSSGEAKPVFGQGTFAVPGPWSPDGTKLLACELRSNSDSRIYLVDLGSGEATSVPVSPEEEAVRVPGPWKVDGSGFYFRSDAGREFRGLGFFDLASGHAEWVETPEHDIDDVAASESGRVLGWIVNEDGYDRLKIRAGESGDPLTPDVPRGARPHLTGFIPPLALSRDGSRAALVLSGPRHAGELYVVDTASGETIAVTESFVGGGISGDVLADAELVSYPTFDEREIPAWLYRPPQAEGRIPVVLAIHGGPEAQEKPVYTPLYQYLVSRGIAVLATNIRGSTGYGKSYQRLVQRDWGGGDLRDWDYAVRWLHSQDWVDPARIGVWGGSYGGFAVLTCVTRLPDHWAAAVDIYGPSNLITFAKAVPPTWKRMMKRFVGDPEEDTELLRERSPLTYIENVRAPLLVIQGAKDPRVVKNESDQLVEKLRELGRTVEYIVFDDEGHGFTKHRNELRAMQASADWLERYLLADRE